MLRPLWLCATLVFGVLTPSLSADVTIGGARPTTLHVPENYDPQVPAPLILFLHGCPSDAAGPFGENVLRLGPAAKERGILFAAPDGTGSPGQRSWGTCSGSYDEHSAYLRSLIEEARKLFNVDRARIYVVGYSDGGVMAYELAADHGDVVAAFVSLAGAPFEWNPPTPVPFLLVGGTLDAPYERQVEVADQFVRDATWDLAFEEIGPGPDLVAGVRTRRTRWGIGCLPDGFFEVSKDPNQGAQGDFDSATACRMMTGA